MDVQLRDEPVSDDVRSAAQRCSRCVAANASRAMPACALGGSARCGVSPCGVVLGGPLVLLTPSEYHRVPSALPFGTADRSAQCR